MRWLPILLFPALVSPVQAQSQPDTRSIEITVLDIQGLPVLGAQVTALEHTANLSRTATSSTERFRLDGLAAGAYTVRVSARGFQVQDVAVDLRNGTTQQIEVRLKPAGITEQVVVTPTRSEQRVADVPASVSIVTTEQIERSPAVVADTRTSGRAPTP